METQAIRQHNPCFVQRSGAGNKQFAIPFALCVLILETGIPSSCRVADNVSVIILSDKTNYLRLS
ncbi:hypothetical protein CIG40_26915 [Klebsiella pneumoniae]|nr:hypothetical protein RJA_17175 [Klebsiella pneumoniae subsp. pneumoniae]OSP36674.1 hypothetical protein B5U79_09765 [Klebsiella pneumoniae]OWU93060.1 hypothetical protein B5K12_27835 [Klebsiella pneumoniae subsp. pneumoniae]OZP78716.1 hypothetical protein CIG52_13385 [Klebsiella pneumoniae]OZQ14552.1 hypothetical protein CIG40_26915 [Klebsiella pneumoniae]